MANPVLVEITRGGVVESRHRGAVAVVDVSGRPVLAIGDIEAAVFPRSAIKIIQALPLVESGAADAYHFDDAALALACSSHNGEPAHLDIARAMLAAAGLDEQALICGPQPPRREDDLLRLRFNGGQPGRLHNNCSGKHAGMLAFARHTGLDHRDYGARRHGVQQAVAAALEDVTGVSLACAPCGVDGCSIPTCAIPLRKLAQGFARIATQQGMAGARAKATRRLMAACFAHPHMVAGTGRFCTDVMSALNGRVFVKTGAEGVFCAAFPDLGLGVALKCDDGATRAAEAAMAALLARCLDLDADERAALQLRLNPPLTNWMGLQVGDIHVVPDLFN